MRGTTCHAAVASKDAAVVYARRHAPSVSCPLGSMQSLHGITCHAADAHKGAASELSATLRVERPLPSCGQRLTTVRHPVPCCSRLQERVQPASRVPGARCQLVGRRRVLHGVIRHAACFARRVTCRVYVIISWAVANRCVSARAVLRLCSRVKTFELSAASRAKRTPTSRVW